MCNGAPPDFSKEENGGNRTGLLIETGILEMLEAKDYENIALVLPCAEEVVDICCGNTKNTPVTDVFNNYDGLIQTFRK